MASHLLDPRGDWHCVGGDVAHVVSRPAAEPTRRACRRSVEEAISLPPVVAHHADVLAVRLGLLLLPLLVAHLSGQGAWPHREGDGHFFNTAVHSWRVLEPGGWIPQPPSGTQVGVAQRAPGGERDRAWRRVLICAWDGSDHGQNYGRRVNLGWLWMHGFNAALGVGHVS